MTRNTRVSRNPAPALLCSENLPKTLPDSFVGDEIGDSSCTFRGLQRWADGGWGTGAKLRVAEGKIVCVGNFG